MLNLGFFEVALFAIIALIVLGPDKLIATARTLGKWYGNFRRLSARLQHEFVSELELAELQKELKDEIAKIKTSENELKSQIHALQHSLNQHKLSETFLGEDWDTPKPLTNRFFLLGDYDKKRRLPPPPFLPNHQADKLLTSP